MPLPDASPPHDLLPVAFYLVHHLSPSSFNPLHAALSRKSYHPAPHLCPLTLVCINDIAEITSQPHEPHTTRQSDEPSLPMSDDHGTILINPRPLPVFAFRIPCRLVLHPPFVVPKNTHFHLFIVSAH